MSVDNLAGRRRHFRNDSFIYRELNILSEILFDANGQRGENEIGGSPEIYSLFAPRLLLLLLARIRIGARCGFGWHIFANRSGHESVIISFHVKSHESCRNFLS